VCTRTGIKQKFEIQLNGVPIKSPISFFQFAQVTHNEYFRISDIEDIHALLGL
jgi:hypothetical protein